MIEIEPWAEGLTKILKLKMEWTHASFRHSLVGGAPYEVDGKSKCSWHTYRD